jgi:hypothetical protein
MATTGYSGTPLAKKLGIKPGSQVVVINGPSNYRELLEPLPEGTALGPSVTATTDVVHVFSASRAELTSVLASILEVLRADAAVWVSWPKKASKVATDITEDTIRSVALPLGLVDIKVCAVTDVWSGLKLVIRKEKRGVTGRL